jgi:hypothetical protein
MTSYDSISTRKQALRAGNDAGREWAEESDRVYLTAPGIGAVVVASYDAEGRSLNADDARAIRRSLRARGGR